MQLHNRTAHYEIRQTNCTIYPPPSCVLPYGERCRRAETNISSACVITQSRLQRTQRKIAPDPNSPPPPFTDIFQQRQRHPQNMSVTTCPRAPRHNHTSFHNPNLSSSLRKTYLPQPPFLITMGLNTFTAAVLLVAGAIQVSHGLRCALQTTIFFGRHTRSCDVIDCFGRSYACW